MAMDPGDALAVGILVEESKLSTINVHLDYGI